MLELRARGLRCRGVFNGRGGSLNLKLLATPFVLFYLLVVVAATSSPSQHSVHKNIQNNSTGVITPERTVQTKTGRPKKSLSFVHSNVPRSQADSLRRIQREWKDVVKLGIGFDWKRGVPFQSKSSKGKHRAKPQHIYMGPINKNLWVWHFSFEGLPGSAFDSGIYHGRIVLPPDYPAKPPRVQVWTPSGRFHCKKDVCLSASNYHPETWRPSDWSVRTIVESLRLHMITLAQEIGGRNDSYEERRRYAEESRKWKMHVSSTITVDHECMLNNGLFSSYSPDVSDTGAGTTTISQEVRELQWGKDDANSFQYPKESSRRQKKTVSGQYVNHEQSALGNVNSAMLHIFRTLRSPFRLAIVSFVLLFVILNK